MFRLISMVTFALVCFGAVCATAHAADWCEDGWNYEHYVLFKHFGDTGLVECSILVPTIPGGKFVKGRWDPELATEKRVMIVPEVLAEIMERNLGVPDYLKGHVDITDPLSIMRAFDLDANLVHWLLHRALETGMETMSEYHEAVQNALDSIPPDEQRALGLR